MRPVDVYGSRHTSILKRSFESDSHLHMNMGPKVLSKFAGKGFREADTEIALSLNDGLTITAPTAVDIWYGNGVGKMEDPQYC